MTNKEMNTMDALLGATKIHIDELDREIETIRTERMLKDASPPRAGLPSRARAGLGRGLIALGVALGGDPAGRPTRTATSDTRLTT
jgi:hypothetical protein